MAASARTLTIAGGDLVLPDRILPGADLLIADGRIVSIRQAPVTDGASAPPGRVDGGTDPRDADVVDALGHFVVPGFIDVHVHGVEGYDTLDAGEPVAEIAARLPKYGVTAFCPTSVACPPDALDRLLRQVAAATTLPRSRARVLPAHLESNFVSREFAGAQPVACLRTPSHSIPDPSSTFTGRDILDVIARARAAVGIVTLAPELPGALDLIRTLVAAGHRVSLGHSGADLETAMAAIDAGARHATHLFNRMPPLGHRAPGLAGAALSRDEVAVELICDGYHVHPAMARMAIAAKGPAKVLAITDGTAGSGMPRGAVVRLGGRPIRVGDHAAVLDDGTLAGSTATMDGMLRTIVTRFGRSIVEAARMCATTPAVELGLADAGAIAENHLADLVVLSRDLEVRATIVGGALAYRAPTLHGSAP